MYTLEMRILLLRANSLRHIALENSLLQVSKNVFSIVENRDKVDSTISSPIVRHHFAARNQSEIDFFYDLVSQAPNENITRFHLSDSINNESTILLAKKMEPDYIISFGCSILSLKWIETFQSKILGIHLGLSPYYRGSGSNFFPFVNNELGASGFTLMSLDEGIDTGRIVHQARAKYVLGDSIHSVGNRVIRNMFKEINRIVQLKLNLSDSITQDSSKGHLFFRRDFNEESLKKALKNIQNGAIENYLEYKELYDEKFTIIENIKLKEKK